FRPGQEQQIGLVRRLAKAGTTHVFVGGDRGDIAIIARDARAQNIPLVLMGGDSMRAADQPVPLTVGVRAVTLPEYDLLPDGLAAANALREKGIEAEGYVLPAAAATYIAGQAVGNALAGNRPLLDALVGTTFQTVVGPVTFGQ